MNPPTNRYCHQCGEALEAPASEHFGRPRDYTPKHLADKILQDASALHGERKQVTVLFVDVSGFTSLSERLDPEDVHGLMRRAFDLLLAEVHRYEGTVNQFLGDGIMALFGAPIAHEDHARRAVHAALGIARALHAWQSELAPRGISFRARQGLHTGLVVVGAIGGDLRMDYTAVGDTTNVAARLQQVSEPGRVTISEATHRLVRGYFETRELGAMHLKGRQEPVVAWEALAPRAPLTRLELESARGLTPLVGRERELQVLEEAFASARSGHGRVAFVVGEPGIGKSRLLLELRQRIGHGARWHEGRCLSFGRTMPFHPLVDLVRQQFGLDERADDATTVARINEGLRAIHEDLASAAPYLRALLSLDPGDEDVRAMNPAQRRGETLQVLRRILTHASQREPQVVVIEDLHWIDGASEEFFVSLVDSVPTLRVLLILTYRPGYASPFGDRSYFARLTPAALSAQDSARMAAALLSADTLPDELRTLLGARAEGNPFYIEEVVKALEETGALQRAEGRLVLASSVSTVTIPATIHDVIAARIDRLGEGPKRALQVASVIGREFSKRLADRVGALPESSEAFFRQLTALELIHERRVEPELVYTFKHALTQDVAYDSLLVQRRRELHALVGQVIEDLYAERLPEQYEVLAHHFSKAEAWQRALEYLLKAADKATQAFGLRQALEHYRDALDAVQRLGDVVPPATVMRIHRARADLLFGIGDFGGSHTAAEQALAIARHTGDQRAEAAALVQMASALQWEEDFPAAHARVREAITVAPTAGASRELAGALYIRAYLESVNGRLDAAEADIVRARDIGQETGDVGRSALSLQLMSMTRGWQGSYDDGIKLAAEGIRIAREHRLVIPLLRNLWTQGMAWNDLGQYDDALAALTEGLALSETIGDDAFIPRFLNTVGWLRIECGDYVGGIALSERSYEITERSSRAGHGTGAERRAFIRNNEADAFMAQGELNAAAEALDESLHTVQHPPPSQWMTWRYAMHCHASRGQLALLRGDPAGAARCADDSLEHAAPTRSRKFESWAWRIKGESAAARRAWPEAETALRRSVAIAESIRQPRQMWLSHLALGRLETALGRHDEAHARYAAAYALVASLRARTRHAELLRGLTSSPLARELETLAR